MVLLLLLLPLLMMPVALFAMLLFLLSDFRALSCLQYNWIRANTVIMQIDFCVRANRAVSSGPRRERY